MIPQEIPASEDTVVQPPDGVAREYGTSRATGPDVGFAALEGATAEDRVLWAHQRFGDKLILTTSFGIQAAVMLHLVTRVVPDIPVVFIDTGYLFPETYRFARDLTTRLKLNLKRFRAEMSAAEQEALFGRQWEDGAEGLARYNLMNKVEPMDRAVRQLGAAAWLAGLRREQASSRQALDVVKVQNRITKVHPIIDWTNRDVHRYLKKYDLPYHPLWDQGYVSVGDWHSTTKLEPGMTEEQTRFNGAKRECGLHENSGRVDFQI
ncbi:phosphoadenylyl-sulfate reductase [Opitutales bacterium ASA1]|nr:phosphoadenylyl-sulfate reductase [Opitutales bacterium ASA1]